MKKKKLPKPKKEKEPLKFPEAGRYDTFYNQSALVMNRARRINLDSLDMQEWE